LAHRLNVVDLEGRPRRFTRRVSQRFAIPDPKRGVPDVELAPMVAENVARLEPENVPVERLSARHVAHRVRKKRDLFHH
jgi:hypothetical protein